MMINLRLDKSHCLKNARRRFKKSNSFLAVLLNYLFWLTKGCKNKKKLNLISHTTKQQIPKQDGMGMFDIFTLKLL